ncbi:MAG: hypothetical protein CMQ24_09660 [Gammaproteobacteria bacterium]|nr:hypothetical protein [Gammaproteobacteria bacterium]
MHLNYEVAGTTGPAMLLVHGFLSSTTQWLPNVDRLSANHRVVMADLWGHGGSPTPEPNAFSIARYLEEFEHIRETLGIERWAVGGQSYAAGLAIRYAIQYPERTTAVITTNSRSAFGEPIQRQAGPRSAPPDADTTGNRHIPVHPIHAKRLPQDLKDKLVEAADGVTPEALERSGLLAPDLNAMALLDQVPVPMLLANGKYEKRFQAAVATVREHHPKIEVVDMPGGHAVNIDAAEAFDTALVRFLARL